MIQFRLHRGVDPKRDVGTRRCVRNDMLLKLFHPIVWLQQTSTLIRSMAMADLVKKQVSLTTVYYYQFLYFNIIRKCPAQPTQTAIRNATLL